VGSWHDLQGLLLVRPVRAFIEQVPVAAMMPRFYVIVALMLGSALFGFGAAWRVQAWRFKAIEHDRLVQIQRDTQKRMDRADEAAVSHETAKAKTEVEYVTVTKTVTKYINRPVYSAQCIDDPGRVLINGFAAGRISDPGQPAPAVSATPKP
jgi:hypothetical protein